MATILPFALASDRTEKTFIQEGSAAILDYGFAIHDLGRSHHLHNVGELFKQTTKTEAAALAFFKNNPKAKLRRLLRNRHARTKRAEVCLDILRPVALLSASVLRGKDSIDLNDCARYLAQTQLRSLDIPSEVLLEVRRKLLAVALEDILYLQEIPQSHTPYLQVNHLIFQQIAGGRHCLAQARNHKELTEIRKERCRQHDRRPREELGHPRRSRPKSAISEKIRRLPNLSPQGYFDELTGRGYVGQEAVRKRLCLMLWRHVDRLRDIYIDGRPPEELLPTSPVLISGPTGSGKTFLMQNLAEIAGLPYGIVDITQYSETGYVGKSIEHIFEPLLDSADGSSGFAQHGILAIDEMDKIMQPPGDSMVSRAGVQRSLLKILEGTRHHQSANRRDSKREATFDTWNTFFVGLGVFPSFQDSEQEHKTIGFLGSEEEHGMDAREAEQLGFSGEIFGRFTGGVLKQDPLTSSDLETILKRGIASQYIEKFDSDGLHLEIEEDVYTHMAMRALEMKTNARGLKRALLDILGDYEFDLRSGINTNLRLFLKDGEVEGEVWSHYFEREGQCG
jgi:ATP-dependent Clp protease ATP-binding subunit ClpX